MKLAASSYYYKPIADPAELLCREVLLRDHIERIQGEFVGYGYRRLGKQLRREGICVNDKRIRRGRVLRSPPPTRIMATRFIRTF